MMSGKAELEEKLKESEYTRTHYRRDLEHSQDELDALQKSLVQSTRDRVAMPGKSKLLMGA